MTSLANFRKLPSIQIKESSPHLQPTSPFPREVRKAQEPQLSLFTSLAIPTVKNSRKSPFPATTRPQLQECSSRPSAGLSRGATAPSPELRPSVLPAMCADDR